MHERTSVASFARASKSASSDLSTLLTGKFRAMFLSRLNEINEGCEKILPVFHSGRNTMMQTLTVIKQKRPSD